jgi:hypothetical protein
LKVCEDLAKQNAAGIKNINPGITGNINPIIPIIVKKHPHQKKNSLTTLFEEGSTFIIRIYEAGILKKNYFKPENYN